MNVITHPKLFDYHKKLKCEIVFIASIVQNDMEISAEQLKETIQTKDQLINDINKWWDDILTHIRRCNSDPNYTNTMMSTRPAEPKTSFDNDINNHHQPDDLPF